MCVCYNELFVTAHVDDILNADSNKIVFRSCDIQYSNIRKYILYTRCSGRELAMRVRDLGLNTVSYTVYFLLYYFTRNAYRLSRRADLSASADLLVI